MTTMHPKLSHETQHSCQIEARFPPMYLIAIVSDKRDLNLVDGAARLLSTTSRQTAWMVDGRFRALRRTGLDPALPQTEEIERQEVSNASAVGEVKRL